MFVVAARSYLRVGAWRMVRRVLEARRMDARPVLGEVGQPVVVVRGSRDPVVTQPWVEWLADHLEHARLAVVDEGPHGLPYSSPVLLAQVLDAFVETVDDETSAP